MAEIWHQARGLNRGAWRLMVNDRPMVTEVAGFGVRLELADWDIELPLAECQHIAEAIGWVPEGLPPRRFIDADDE